MPNISSLTMPDGIVYAIKDSQARKDIEDIKKNGSAGSGSVSGGGVEDIDGTLIGNNKCSVNKPLSKIASAMQQGARICAIQETTVGGITYRTTVYLSILMVSYQDDTLTTLAVTKIPGDNGNYDALIATETDGITTFAPA